MSETSPKALTETERATLFADWLKPLQPIHPTRETIIVKIAPFRHHFLDAVNRGFGWKQLASDVASKPEIGLKITGFMLKQCVLAACAQAGERVPRQRKSRHNRGKSAAKSAKVTAPVS